MLQSREEGLRESGIVASRALHFRVHIVDAEYLEKDKYKRVRTKSDLADLLQSRMTRQSFAALAAIREDARVVAFGVEILKY
jgi:hypothetical protein